jgi:spore coat protein A, manganese oxidase
VAKSKDGEISINRKYGVKYMKNEKIIGSDIMNDVETKKDFMRMDRRTFVKLAGATAGALALGKFNLIPNADAAPKFSFKKFVDPLLAAIPKLTPDTTAYPGKDYYEIYMKDGKFPFSNQLPVTALSNTTWGYGSNYNQGGADVFLGYLGPTIEATRGTPVIVKFINNLPTITHPLQASIDPTVPDPAMYPGLVPGRATPHLHGGFTDPNSDGHPHSWFTASGVHGSHYATLPNALANEAIFEYTNAQPAANLWYHDHAMGITRLNVYAGLAGLYFIRDTFDTGISTPTNPLPAGQYEIPLVIQDKQFNPDGSLFYPTIGVTATHPIWVPEFFGDTAVVNGHAFPFLNVEPRRYRFRIVNGSQARFYNLWLAGPGKSNLPLWVIGMEQSLLPAPVQLQTLLLAPGERADIIVDFTGQVGATFTMSNDANTPYPGGGKRAGAKIPDIMQINVVSPLVGTDNTTSPATLILPPIDPTPTPTPGSPMREIIMKETLDPVTLMPIHIRLNELWFNDPIEETPKSGTTETWQFINLTVDAHPMHMHLVKFKVVNRQAFNVLTYTTAYLAWVAAGRNPATKPVLANYLIGLPLPPAPEESGWKDTVKAYPGQITRVISTFDVPTGTALPAEYVYHCHILEHEENEMMRPMQVVV